MQKSLFNAYFNFLSHYLSRKCKHFFFFKHMWLILIMHINPGSCYNRFNLTLNKWNFCWLFEM